MNPLVGGVIAEIAKNKRKWEEFVKGERKLDGRQEVVETYAIKAGENLRYTENQPKCDRYEPHHSGWCAETCRKCCRLDT